MGTYYIVDTRSYFNASHMEYVQNDDKVHLILRGIPKTGEKADFINNKYIQNNITYSVIKGFSDDTVDFTLVPMICEIINKVKDMQVVVISRNFKLFCLTSYYKNQLGYNLEIADSIKDYNSIKYIQKAVNISYEEALNVFRGFVKYRTCKAKGVSSATRRKIEKDIEVYRNIMEITNIDFDEVLQDNSILLISGNVSTEFEKRLSEYDIELSETALKRIAYFLKKSDNYNNFCDRLNSNYSVLGLDKETKEKLFEYIRLDLFKGIL